MIHQLSRSMRRIYILPLYTYIHTYTGIHTYIHTYTGMHAFTYIHTKDKGKFRLGCVSTVAPGIENV